MHLPVEQNEMLNAVTVNSKGSASSLRKWKN